MKTRDQIEEKYKWDLSCYGITDENFYDKCKELEKFEEKVFALKGKLNSDEDILKALKLQRKRDMLYSPLYMYLHAKRDEDLANSTYQEMKGHLTKINVSYCKNTLFLDIFMKNLPTKHLKSLLADKRFKEFSISLSELIEDKKHRLPDSVDKFLTGATFFHPQGNIMRQFSDVDLTFDDVKDKNGKLLPLNPVLASEYLEREDRVLRRNTLKNLHDAYGKFINTLALNYANSVKENNFFSKARKYEDTFDAAMHSEKVDRAIYDTLIKNVRANLPVLFDYFELKRKKLGLKDFWNYDTYVHVKGAGKKYTYDQAIELVKKAVAPLGEEYVGLIQRAKDERWIDVYPNKNKRSGAYSTSIYGYHPFILTNFNGMLEDVYTLAHELGHAMHSYYSDKTQDMEKSEYKIFVAEVASTTNEMLLTHYLLNNAKTEDEKEEIYDKLFIDVKSTIFRQTMFAEFEERIYRLQSKDFCLTKDKICDVYYALNQDYFGKKVKLLDEVKYEWARIPHFFTPFYVYKYATGLICAINFASKIASGDKKATKDYIEKFLCAGQSKPPVQILADAGCDLNKTETYSYVFNYLNDILTEWKKI